MHLLHNADGIAERQKHTIVHPTTAFGFHWVHKTFRNMITDSVSRMQLTNTKAIYSLKSLFLLHDIS